MKTSEAYLKKNRLSSSLPRRFSEKYEIKDLLRCWNWTGSKDKHGYGHIRRGYPFAGCIQAHAASWVLFNGPIPSGMCVLHRCDNPSCVNFLHLWIGTRLDNARDMVLKGRQYKGDVYWAKKLTSLQVAKIRKSFNGKHGHMTALARKFGVSQQNIKSILRNQTWKRV